MLCSEAEAIDYLCENNNYFRIKSYRQGFPRAMGGPRNGQYTNVDFAMLKDLAIIDMHLRNTFLPLTLDIEHFMKMRLLSETEANGEDGYSIVQKYFATPDGKYTIREVQRGADGCYTSDLIARYPDNGYPIWALLELLSFGRLNHFYKFCADCYSNKAMREDFYLLQAVKDLRNACAHGNCIINNLGAGVPRHKVQQIVIRGLADIGISKTMRDTKLRNERLQHIATTLYLHARIASLGVKEHQGESLHCLLDRMNRHVDYYQKNDQIKTGFLFIEKMIMGWYPCT